MAVAIEKLVQEVELETGGLERVLRIAHDGGLHFCTINVPADLINRIANEAWMLGWTVSSTHAAPWVGPGVVGVVLRVRV